MTGSLSHIEGVVTPFLKWAGGKRRLLAQYEPYFPRRESVNHYYEPFIGSAAVYFHLRYPQATLSDRNEKLIEVYRMVQRDVEGVIRALQPYRNEEEHYYQVRAQDPAALSPIERAARLLYLNRTCYNGLFRENRRGKFNVPFGRYKNPNICNRKKLRKAARALNRVNLRVADFADVVEGAQAGDFVYFDPPYVPLNATSNFTSYDSRDFTSEDHQRLAKTVRQLTAKGVLVMLSNSSAELVYQLYGEQDFRLITIEARRNINSRPDRRGPVKELLILNYDSEGAIIGS